MAASIHTSGSSFEWETPKSLFEVQVNFGGGGRGGHPEYAVSRDSRFLVNQIIEETIDYLAVAMANLQAVLDPERIILGGGIAAAAGRIIPGIEQRLAPLLPMMPVIVRSELGYRAGVLGAAAALADAG